MANDQLQLRYDFLPSPNPILVSQAGENPRTVDLQVMVSNSGAYPVSLCALSITIPVGAEAAGTLSSAPALPQPYADAGFPFAFSVEGSTITLCPNGTQTGGSGTSGTCTPGPCSGATGTTPVTPVVIPGTLLFTIPGIIVNEMPGIVQITLAERTAAAGLVNDDTTYTLVKQPAEFPVTAFRAEPAIITDLDQPTTLYWACTPAGHGYVYALRSDDRWQPSDCLEQGNCLTCRDGETGVATPPLSQAMVFYLDVIGTVTGVRKVITTVQLPVPVAVPQVSQNSFTRQSSVGTGQLVSVHWVAYNAARCSVLLDGSPVVEDAPVDTYLHGYPLVLPAAPGTYQLAVVAHALSGDMTASQVLPDVSVSAPVTLPVGNIPTSVAVTPDGTLALVPDWQQTLNVVDLAARTTRAHVTLGDGAGFVAVTPDGALALVAKRESNDVHVVSLATLQVEAGVLPVGAPHAIAVTPDGALALVQCEDGIYVVDIAARRVEPGVISTQGTPTGLAISADGRRAVASYQSVNALAVIDVASRTLDGEPIDLGGFPTDVALTPDGRFALVCDIQDGTPNLVDVPARRMAADPIPVSMNPSAAAFSRDGLFGVVVSANEGTLTVI